MPRRDVGPYQVLRADCLLALGRHGESLALLQEQAEGQQGAQRALFDARLAVHRAAAVLDEPGEAADALCREALQAVAGLSYSRFLRPLPLMAARLVERGLRLGVAPTSCVMWCTSAGSCRPTAPVKTGLGGCA